MTEWIPVSERLPERKDKFGWLESDNVLVCYGASWIAMAKYVQRVRRGKTEDRWELLNGRIITRVIAWMPLPEPYEGEQDE